MTVVVGILNRRGAVMAADSAVTVSNAHGTKIYNSATKIFPLSGKFPVGVMIYNNASFMGTPLDVILELYRVQRGDQEFGTLKEYAENFLEFLAAENYFTNADGQKSYFDSEVADFYGKIISTIEARLEESCPEGPGDDASILESIAREVIADAAEIYGKEDICDEFKDYHQRSMVSYGKDIFDEIENDLAKKGLPSSLRGDLENVFYAYIKSTLFFSGSGIVFVGYGKKDIYPSLLSMFLSGAFERRLRYMFVEDDAATVGGDCTATIKPFAQRDVIDNMIWGIHPDVERTVVNLNHNAVESTREKILKELEDSGVKQSVLDKVAAMDLNETEKVFQDSLVDYERNNFIDGILDAVDSFNMSDVANMAESLVSLTYLQRHISSSEESVGGPVDVAVITKVNGFQWVKHKIWPPECQ